MYSTSSSSSFSLLVILLLIGGSFLTQVTAKSDVQSQENLVGDKNVEDPSSSSSSFQWLNDIEGGDSDVAKSRTRRFVPFPTGSTISLATTLSIPIQAIGQASDLALSNTLTFDLPTSSVTGRSYQSRKADRFHIYSQMEHFLEDLGYNGHACTLRTLCEIAEAPFEHGLYGEIINLVLSASVTPHENSVYDEYMTAEYYGQNYGNCEAIYSDCPKSVLDIMSSAF